MTFYIRLDSRFQSLLERVMEVGDYIGVRDIAEEKNVSKRSLYYEKTCDGSYKGESTY